MNFRRFLQLGLLGWCLVLLVLLAITVANCYHADLYVAFSWWLVPATVAILHRHCKELPGLGWLVCLALTATLGSAILLPNFIRTSCGGSLTACKSNLKNLATSLEMYSTDNAGRYPLSLTQLTPQYLKNIPRCPTAQKDTYSSAYALNTEPDAYTVVCGGCHHHSSGIIEPNYPQYSSYSGLILP